MSSSESISSESESSSSSYYEALYGVHPITYVVKEELKYKDGWVFASVLLDIRTTDTAFLNQFGPAVVDFGGTYGTNFIPQDLRRVVDELRIVKSFRSCTSLTAAAADAQLWQNTMVNRVTRAIWDIRNKRLGLPPSTETAEGI